MKIITYNLRSGGKCGGVNHWKKVIVELGADLVLAQETYNPQSYFRDDGFEREGLHGVWNPISTWGSAVVVKGCAVTPVTVPGFEGWVAGAQISGLPIGKEAGSVCVFSIHAPSPGPYPPQVQKILDEISNLSLDAEIVIAGDFNLDTAVRHPSEDLKNEIAERAIIDRLRREFGLVNAWQAVHPNENLPQTLRWSGDQSKSYHCDGIFIPVSWLPCLERCEVVTGWEDMSDHNPILAMFR